MPHSFQPPPCVLTWVDGRLPSISQTSFCLHRQYSLFDTVLLGELKKSKFLFLLLNLLLHCDAAVSAQAATEGRMW